MFDLVPLEYVYLVALVPFLCVWIIFFHKRKDLRKEILVMSILFGTLSVLASYYWWTIDWWQPPTITGTRVGIEDFLMGFAAGGIITALYPIFTHEHYKKRLVHHHFYQGVLWLLVLANIMWWLISAGWTTFWASTVSMLFVASAIFLFIRRDLLKDAIISGVLMTLVAWLFYGLILLISSEWITITYLGGISGVYMLGVPIEEFIFWYLAGLLFGPFYKYWFGIRLNEK